MQILLPGNESQMKNTLLAQRTSGISKAGLDSDNECQRVGL